MVPSGVIRAKATAVIASLFAVTATTAVAQCPSGQKSNEPFSVATGSTSISEVYRLETGDTRIIGRYRDGSIVEQTYYQGLVRTEHFDRGQRRTYVPRGDLKKHFPLKVGQTMAIELDATGPRGEKQVLRAEHKVVGRDRISIGPCNFEVLKIEHSNRFGEGPLIFINTDWFAPDLKLILAREYKRPGGGSDIRKYDSIAILKDGKPASLSPSDGKSN